MASRIVLFSGAHSIDPLGATRTIDTALVHGFVGLGQQVYWIGKGTAPSDACGFSVKEVSVVRQFARRVSAKLRRIWGNHDSHKDLLREYRRVDRAAAGLISSGRVPVDTETIVMGRNGMSLATFEAASRRGAKTILHAQWMHPFTQRDCLGAAFARLNLPGFPILPQRLRRQLQEIELVDRIWCISSLVWNSFRQQGVAEAKLLQCSLGVAVSRFARPEHLTRSQRFRLLFVGNVNAEKGAHLLLEALLSGAFFDLDVVFNGCLAPDFAAIFGGYQYKLAEQNVVVTVGPGDPRENYWRSSVFVLPSVHESFGLVVLEAMAAGLPVVVSDNVGAKDCIVHQECGLIFKNGDVQDLARSIALLKNNPCLLTSFGDEAAKTARAFDWQVVCPRLLRILSDSA